MLRFLALLLVPAGVMACGFAMPAPPPLRHGGPHSTEFELEMGMTLVLRFSDAGNASGMIYFEGTGTETECSAGMPTETSSEFRAGAPVTLSR